MSHIFLSYARDDEEYARELQSSMEQSGLTVWRDLKDIDHGDEWLWVIEQQLDQSVAVAVIMSADSGKSRYVLNEVLWAQRKNIPVFPLLLAGEPFFALAGTHFLDVTDGQLPPEDWHDQLRAVDRDSSVASQDRAVVPSPTEPVSVEERASSLATRLRALLAHMRFGDFLGRTIMAFDVWGADGVRDNSVYVSISKFPYLSRYRASAVWFARLEGPQGPTMGAMNERGWMRSGDPSVHAEGTLYSYKLDGRTGSLPGDQIADVVAELLVEEFDVGPMEHTVSVMRPKQSGDGYKAPIRG